jgi:hypothetical protein
MIAERIGCGAIHHTCRMGQAPHMPDRLAGHRGAGGNAEHEIRVKGEHVGLTQRACHISGSMKLRDHVAIPSHSGAIDAADHDSAGGCDTRRSDG